MTDKLIQCLMKTIIIILTFSTGSLMVIIGLPETCKNTAMYTIEQIQEAKYLLFLCLAAISLCLFMLYVMNKEKKC